MGKKLSCVVALALVLSLASGAWADLVGHWKLDESGGTTAVDSSGNGYNGAVQGNPVWAPGAKGGAMQCDGDDWINCGDVLTLTQGLTVMCWVNPGDLTGDHGYASREGAYALKSSSTHLRFTTPGVLDYDGNATILTMGEWQHVAATMVPNTSQGLIFYLNGAESERLNATALNAGAGPFRIANNQWAAQFFIGAIDDVRVYDNVLTAEEIMEAMVAGGPELASGPSPESEAADVPADSVLTWTPGKFAATHDVYLGTAFDDVNDASRTNAMGVLASQGQADAEFDPDGLLEYGQTYYWRIDEVNGAPDNTIFKGDVWSFTVEPYAYPIANVTATASTFQPSMPPENAVNGLGLNADDQHSTESTQMWMTTGGLPAWIQFEFDQVQVLHELWVWNSNQVIESFLGFGAKDVTVEYSEDGENWTALEGAPQFAKATGTGTYTANTIVEFGGAAAKFVKLTINSNWGGVTTQTGLSEVRFFAVPVRAFEPEPADGAADVSIATEFNWRPGREATSHEVYLGTDANEVAAATVPDATVTDHSYTPDALDLGTTYFWRVDEVGDAGTYKGDVWSFTTEDFAVVDNFESYNDDIDAETTIWHAWVDGLTTGASGSQVGYDVAPFAEKTIIHSGAQSMPLIYDNSSFPVSEAEIELDQDWTASGIKSLSLYFQGTADNTGQLYVKINNTKVPYDGPAGDIAEASWLPWNIDLSTVAGNLSNVTSLTIGVEGAGASGTLYIDDIRLYPMTPEFTVPVQPAATGLVAQYKFDGDLRDSVGANHGTAAGDAKVASDPARGQVLSVDGNGDKVDIAYNAALNPTEFTVSLWAYPDSGSNLTLHRSPITSRDDAPQRGYIVYIDPSNVWQFWTGTGSGWNAVNGPAAQLDEWAHVAATFANDQKMFYINGRLVGQGTAALALNAQQPLRIGAGASEGPGNYFFRGLIDDVRLYNRALPAEEVAGLAGRTEPLHKPF